MMRSVMVLLMTLLSLPLQAAEQKASVLYYRLSEPGVDPYLSRWLVTSDFLRIDEGNATTTISSSTAAAALSTV